MNSGLRDSSIGIVLLTAVLFIAAVVTVVSFPDDVAAMVTVTLLALCFVAIFRHYADEKEFVTGVFFLALGLRFSFAIFVQLSGLQEFFAGDALSFDLFGSALRDSWFGIHDAPQWVIYEASRIGGAGWGMNYFVAALYTVFGRNFFAAQCLCGVIGAAISPMVYFCSKRIYGNVRAAKTAAVIVAVLPAFVIWTGQLLKDGLIIFLLVLAMTMVLVIQEKMRTGAMLLLIGSLAGIFALRFYIFFMVVAAVAGSFFVGVKNSGKSVMTRTAIIAFSGLVLTYVGITSVASRDFQTYGDLKVIQRGRLDQARTGQSGYAVDADISTPGGVVTVLPIGFLYLMLAPFPWEARNIRQAIPLPEVFIWWAMMPLLVSGVIYSIRHRLRKALPILIFSLMLTLVYSVTQGNVGTAYRQRTQIQVFLIIMIAVGWGLRKEKAENEILIRKLRREKARSELGRGSPGMQSGSLTSDNG